MENELNINSIENENKMMYQESGRGTLILAFGIISILLLGPILGIPAWIMGHKDLKKIKSGIISIAEKTSTKVGMILGIIGTFFSTFLIILGIGVVVGINAFNIKYAEVTREALISDCSSVALTALQYYKESVENDGGGYSFIGFDEYFYSQYMDENENGKIVFEKISDASLTIIGIGNEKGNDGKTPIKIKIKVTPNKFEPEIIN